jgi:hypothetical protein
LVCEKRTCFCENALDLFPLLHSASFKVSGFTVLLMCCFMCWMHCTHSVLDVSWSPFQSLQVWLRHHGFRSCPLWR